MTDVRLEVWHPAFTAELTALIRQHGLDAEEGYPARLLADYFLMCLNVLAAMDTQRGYYVRTGWQPTGVPQEDREA